MAPQLDWWVVASKPLPPEGLASQVAGGQKAPAGSRVISTVQGTAEDNAFMGQRDQPSGGTPYRGMYPIFGPFTSKADAQAAVTSPAPGLTSAAGSLLGLPSLSNLRDFVVRAAKVLVGMALIIIGVNSLLKAEGIDVPKPPPVVPV